MRSDKVSRSQLSCWSTMESISSNKSFWSQEVFDRSGSQRALTRAPDRKKFMIDRRSIGVDKVSRSQLSCWSTMESISSNKSFWSQEVFDRSGSQRALIRAPDRQSFWSIGDSMSSGESSRSQNVCCSMRDRMSSNSSSLTQDVWLSIGKKNKLW